MGHNLMFSRILVPVDMSSPEAGQRSCPRANEMAELWGSEVQLLTVLPGYSMPLVANYFPKNAMDEMSNKVTKDLEALASQYFTNTPEVSVRTGKRAQEILDEAKNWNADLIVFGCRPKDALGGELMLGSCGTTVAERAPCSVLVAR